MVKDYDNDNVRVNFTQFNKLYNHSVDWLELTNNIYEASGSSIKVKGDDNLIITAPNIYKYVPKILDETPKHVVANYFGWMIASQLGDFTGRQFKNISDQYEIDKYGKILLGEFKNARKII